MDRLHAVLCLCMALGLSSAAAKPNTLTEKEKTAGWKLLFDGQTTEGWTMCKEASNPGEKWKVANGWLQCLGKGGGDIITQDRYKDFELSWEWKLERGGNSGVKYFVAPERGPVGHEYQILDNENHPDARLANGKRLTGAFYDVLKCGNPISPRAPMETNRSRIIVRGSHVEHWLNGKKLLAYELGSLRVSNAVFNSKFKETKDFGLPLPGHILLQDHQSLVWFRNIKIRDLTPHQETVAP